jgi:6-aminohexanoate-oligomer endohydrolase
MTENNRRSFLKQATVLGLGLAAGSQVNSELQAQDKPRPKIVTKLGPHICAYQFPELKVGSAHYPSGPTGVTVFSFKRRLRTLVDVRGASAGTIFTDQLRQDSASLDGLVFSGGSLYGLEAVAGVSSAIFEGERRGSTRWADIALVSGAVIYDYTLRGSKIYPDKRLARAAYREAQCGQFALGARGAGAGASCGKWLKNTAPEWAGQGAAFIKRGSTKIAVFTVVNSLGALYDRSGKVVRGHKDPKTGRRLDLPGSATSKNKGGNTTLTFVLINHALPNAILRALAREVHSSMARAIKPFHGLGDGDVLYVSTTDSVKKSVHNSYELAAMASECAWDAVLSSFKGRA